MNLFLFILFWFLLIAAAPNPALVSLPSNTAVEVANYTCTTPEGETPNHCRIVTDYSGIVYDSVRAKIYMFGGGHASTNYNAINVFDPVTLTWTEEYAPGNCTADLRFANYDKVDGKFTKGTSGPYPRPAARHVGDQMHVINSELILLGIVEGNGVCTWMNSQPGGYTSLEFQSNTAKAAHYNFSTGTWSFSATATDGAAHFPSTEYDPVLGKVIILSTHFFDVYDPATKIRTRIIDLGSVYVVKDEAGNFIGNDLGYNNVLVYYPPNKKHYLISRTSLPTAGVFEVNPNRANLAATTITKLNTTGTQSPGGTDGAITGYAYDSVNQLIGGGVRNSKFYTFNPLTKAWSNQTMLGASSVQQAYYAITYDPVNNVFFFVNDWHDGVPAKTLAYRAGGTSIFVSPSTPSNLTVKFSGKAVLRR